MSTERDVNRVVTLWLEDGVTVLPDRVLDAVIGQLPATPQRRAGWLARRFPIMNSTVFRVGVAAAAMIVIAFVGYQLLPGRSVGGPQATPTPQPTATPTVAATPVGLPEGEIPPGRYHISSASVHYSYDLTSELWQSSQPGYDGFIETRAAFPGPGFAWITPVIRLDRVSLDPCAGTETAVTSVDAAVTALGQIAGTSAAAPTDLTVDGVPGKLVVLTIDGDFACDETSFWLYGNGSFYPSDKTSVIRDWVFDLDNQTYLFHTDQIGSDAALGDEIEQIIGSIQFE
jgi:hypothetical protein